LMTGLSTRSAALDKRRMEAVEKIWAASTEVTKKLHFLVRSCETLRMEVLIDRAEGSGAEAVKVQEFAKAVLGAGNIDTNDWKAAFPFATAERPFVPPFVWAIYSTYNSLMLHAYARWTAVRFGTGNGILASPDPLLTALKLALPHQSNFIDQFGEARVYGLRKELEDKLLFELSRTLEGHQSDSQHLQRAHEILRAVSELEAAKQPPIVQPPL
jgi:hypothetical protein